MLVAQITDTHIKPGGRLAYGRVDTAGHLGRAVDHLNGMAERPDVVLVTGDIGDAGIAAEYSVARSHLDRLAMPYFVIPGNHDSRDGLRESFVDHAYLPKQGFIHYVIEDYPVRLIGLDSTIPGKAGGMMCAERLEWLAARLSEGDGRPTLVFIHHPPFLTGIRHMDADNCAGGDDFGRLIARFPAVGMLLCGHLHRDIAVGWHGILACTAPSPAHAVSFDLSDEGPPRYHMEPPATRLVYLADDGRLVAHLSPIGSFDGPHPFFDATGKLVD
jgi:Icc protein